jgi:hypothetical protein
LAFIWLALAGVVVFGILFWAVVRASREPEVKTTNAKGEQEKKKTSKGEPEKKAIDSIMWSEVLPVVKKKVESITDMAKADSLLIKAMASEQSAGRLGRMTPYQRQEGLKAMELVERIGIDKVDSLTLRAAEMFAPLEVAILQIGTQPRSNDPSCVEAVCRDFPEGWVVNNGPKIKSSTNEEFRERALALYLFEDSKPPAASDYRRLQSVGLMQLAIAEAVKAGQSDIEPAWFSKRSQSGLAKSLDAERDLVIAVWATTGVLPKNRREKFLQELVGELTNPGSNRDKIVRTAIRD